MPPRPELRLRLVGLTKREATFAAAFPTDRGFAFAGPLSLPKSYGEALLPKFELDQEVVVELVPPGDSPAS